MSIMDDALGVLGKVAPTIATMLGGPLAGTAVMAIEQALGIDPTGDKDAALAAVASATPEQLLALKAEDNRHAEAMEKLTQDRLKLGNDDRGSARSRDVEFIKAGRSNTRANVLLITAGLGIVGGIGFMVFGNVDGNTAVGGCIISVVTLLAGKFATAFDFEFGGSADSEQTRTLLAHAPAIK
ncbi:MAG: hypothetical protein Q7R40_17130 [Phaeospirillum sp.]|nr:hypothetical protein [Phaeospirillum sp.]